MPDPVFSRLSFFLCQQHRPELIYVPEWLQHPNSVSGIAGVTILAEAEVHGALRAKFTGLYGEVQQILGGFKVPTANGSISVQTLDAIEAEFGTLPTSVAEGASPSIVAMDMIYQRQEAFDIWCANNALAPRTTASGCVGTDPEKTANVVLRFVRGWEDERNIRP